MEINMEDSMSEYYDSRDEYDFVGVIDNDIFKIRSRQPNILDNKRDLSPIKNSMRSSSKTKSYLDDIAEKLAINVTSEMTKSKICDAVQQNMLEKEKYATAIDKNKMTYVRIPMNHPKYPFPYNLEDRVEFIINKIRTHITCSLDILTTKETDNDKLFYKISIKKYLI